MKIEQLQERVGRWADQAWPGRTLDNRIIKLQEELGEVAETIIKPPKRPKLGEELADLVIVALDAAYVGGINLAEQIERKQQINERDKVGTDYASWPVGEDGA